MSDDALRGYLAKRNLDVSSEPGGGEPGGRPRFVIQRHDASSLHFDFRLEVDGVLKSWAVPKGPSTDPRDKRLATPTEDHPLDYADFEGRIPAGEYAVAGGHRAALGPVGSDQRGPRAVSPPRARHPRARAGGLTHTKTEAGWTVEPTVATTSRCTDCRSTWRRTRTAKSISACCPSYRRR